MWRCIGSITSPGNKSSKSKEQLSFQPFGQSSRLRLNESQLSGDASQRFMSKYFSQKRSPGTLLQKNKSEKHLEYLNNRNGGASSLKDLNKSASSQQVLGEVLRTIRNQENNRMEQCQNSIQIDLQRDSFQEEKKKEINQQAFILKKKASEDLTILKNEQAKMRKQIQVELGTIKKQLSDFEINIHPHIEKKFESLNEESQQDKEKDKVRLVNVINPETLMQIQLQGVKVTQKIQEIQNRKKELREKLNRKYQ